MLCKVYHVLNNQSCEITIETNCCIICVKKKIIINLFKHVVRCVSVSAFVASRICCSLICFFYNEFLVTLYPETIKYHRSVCCCCCFCGDWWDIGCVMVSKLHAPVWVMHHMTSGHPNYRNILIENLNSTNNKQLWSLVTVKKVGTCTWKYRCTKNDSLVKWLKKTNYSLLCLSAKLNSSRFRFCK